MYTPENYALALGLTSAVSGCKAGASKLFLRSNRCLLELVEVTGWDAPLKHNDWLIHFKPLKNCRTLSSEGTGAPIKKQVNQAKTRRWGAATAKQTHLNLVPQGHHGGDQPKDQPSSPCA